LLLVRLPITNLSLWIYLLSISGNLEAFSSKTIVKMAEVCHLGICWILQRLTVWRLNSHCDSAQKYCSSVLLARSANLPEGLYILLALISSFFIFLIWAKLSQYLLDQFSRSFHQMEGICVNFLDQVQFFWFLNQFCVVRKTQSMCNFCNFYSIWKRFGCRW